MESILVSIIFGIFISIIGFLNMKGNISSIHWYNRKRVTEENIALFGKMIGLGTLVIGISMIIFGFMLLSTLLLKTDTFTLIGSIILIVGLVIGLVLNLYAMIKYNKGIF